MSGCASGRLNVPLSGDDEYVHFRLDAVCVFAVSLWTHCAHIVHCRMISESMDWISFK